MPSTLAEHDYEVYYIANKWDVQCNANDFSQIRKLYREKKNENR